MSTTVEKTKTEVWTIFNVLKLLETKEDLVLNPKTAYALTKNLGIVEKEVQVIEETRKKLQPSEEYVQYQKKRIGILKEFANKDENGTPVKKIDADTGQEIFDIPIEIREEINEKIKNLQEEYNDAILQFEKNEAKFLEMMEEKIDLNVHFISLDDFSADLTLSQMKVLNYIISE